MRYKCVCKMSRRITYPDLSTSTVSLGNVSLSNLTLNLVGSAIAKLLSNLNNSPTVCETMACNSQESILLTDDSLATDKSEEFHTCETLPPPKMILEEFVYWMQSMDGGSHTRDISMKAKHVINNILLEIDMEDIMEPELVCEYFTNKQLHKHLSASSTSVYLRYYSSFILFTHQRYTLKYSLEVYTKMMQRVERYVLFLFILCKSTLLLHSA